MKKTTILLIGLLLLCGITNCGREKARKLASEDSITVYCTPELNSLATEWANEFCAINKDVKINVINVTESSIAKNLDKSQSIAFVTGNYDLPAKTAWKVIVGRDIIVPVFNSNNPFSEEISKTGISPEKLAEIINNSGKRSWGTILNSDHDNPVNLYVLDDASINPGLANLLNKEEVNIEAVKYEEGNQVISAVGEDIFSIGICKIGDAVDFTDNTLAENIKLIPIDRNGNGTIDYMESIYDDLNVLARSIAIGKYPGALTTNIYSLASDKPTGKNELAFLKWTLTAGQRSLNKNGYGVLEFNERLAKVSQIEDYEIIDPITTNYAFVKEPLFFYIYFPIILTFALGLILATVAGLRYRREKREAIPGLGSFPKLLFNEDFVESPEGLYYDKTHTWAFMEKDGLVKIGIDDFLQHITGPLTRVKLKSVGERVKKGKHILSIIQEGKQLDIYAPISGTIKASNELLTSNTSMLNSSPYNEGWVYRIEPTNWIKEIQFMFMGTKYKDWLKSEFNRLKEFLTSHLEPETAQYAYVMQDGGELKDGILSELGPETWEDFQTSFIDVSS